MVWCTAPGFEPIFDYVHYRQRTIISKPLCSYVMTHVLNKNPEPIFQMNYRMTEAPKLVENNLIMESEGVDLVM